MLFPFRQQLETSRLYPLFVLDKFLGHRARHLLFKAIGLTLVFFSLVMLASALAPLWPALDRWLAWLAPHLSLVLGLGLMLLAGWLDVYLAETYFRYYYFNHPDSSFEVGRFLWRAVEPDLVAAFLDSDVGAVWLARLGLSADARDQFLAARQKLQISTPLESKALGSLAALVEILLDGQPDFAKWLLEFEIKKAEALGAARWVERARHVRRESERWWTRERLGRIPGLAKDWAYGESYLLNQYSLDLLTASVTRPAGLVLWYGSAVGELETILARRREANALVVGSGSAPLAVIYELTKLIRSGRVLPALEPQHPKLLRTAVLLSRFKDRQSLEAEMVKIFNEVTKAGNVILVIDDLPSFVAETGAIGANLEPLLEPYLTSGRVQIVALAEIDGYHRLIEPKPFWRERFETVQLTSQPAAVVEQLLAAVETVEGRGQGRPIFTYPAVVALADLGEQFAGAESVVDQALDLLTEIAPWAARRGLAVIGKDAVLKFATEKLHVPLGSVQPEEKEKLLNLEKLLQARVIGQDQAIVAIANALRRSRAGIRSLKRPMGSFLFLGPTGVGKTETAKALAAVFFGGEDRLLRLDMTEYRGPEALGRLIGSLASGEPGSLVKLLRREPYGVLLLDEFEKAETEVLNLFLQILDEGFFSDSHGERVNARNILFIATSNAGAPLIWELVGAGRHLIEAEKMIIESLVKQGIFKPELLNRFDGVVLFNPLDQETGRAVARLLLERLVGRLKERGVIFNITDQAVEAVVDRGLDQQFGARPMIRFIQDQLEQPVAEALIKGQVKSGTSIAFDQNLHLLVTS
ncbi:MAG: ATP-dependent Clp protease ATP-binding subunit [Candidatus Vogelbacteria bacterium]|nr:ATP-dependent Clp protease ATP-binding subunit [Candidatus Vogelbacteria bacterium]